MSDHGEISFTIASGPQATSDGDNFVFTPTKVFCIDQVMPAGPASQTRLELPAEPTIFQYLAGPTGGGWDPKDERTFVMLPVTNSDVVLRVRLKRGPSKSSGNSRLLRDLARSIPSGLSFFCLSGCRSRSGLWLLSWHRHPTVNRPETANSPPGSSSHQSQPAVQIAMSNCPRIHRQERNGAL